MTSSDPLANHEESVRAELRECETTLTKTREARDQANRAIAALVKQRDLLRVVVAAYDRAKARAAKAGA